MTGKLDRFMRIEEVTEATTLSRSTIWRLEKAKKFPPSITITAGRKGWRESAIANWQADPINWSAEGAA